MEPVRQHTLERGEPARPEIKPETKSGSTPARLSGTLWQRLRIDRAVAFTLLARGWTAFAGLPTLFLLTRFLSPVQQGFYFTFSSMLGLIVFFELGLSLVILQFASHERAKLHWSSAGTLEGDPIAKARLSSLLRLSMIWFGVAAGLILVVLLPAGMLFFGRHAPPGVVIAWRLPWIWIVLVTAGTIALNPMLSLLEGCGLIAEIAAVQATQNILGSLLLWLALWQHWGLFAAPVTNTVGFLCTLVWLWRRKMPGLRDLAFTAPKIANIHWRTELWPLQWKTALSCVSGYFVFQLFNPILFSYHGAKAAGQMGLSLAIIGAIATISLAWMTTKSATFGTLIARHEYVQLDHLFFPCLWQSLTLVSLGGLAVWTAALYLHIIHHPLSQRILEPGPMGFLIGSIIINHIVLSEAIYLRAHKQEPFAGLGVLMSCLVGLSSFFLGRAFGALGMMIGYFFINLTLGLGGGTWLFIQKRRLWQHRV